MTPVEGLPGGGRRSGGSRDVPGTAGERAGSGRRPERPPRSGGAVGGARLLPPPAIVSPAIVSPVG